jgi:group II intron reverse transcriptase/maturase
MNMQLKLSFVTAENPPDSGVQGDKGVDLSYPNAPRGPKAKRKSQTAGSAMMLEVCEGLNEAFAKVAANKGAPGPNRRTIEEVRKNLPHILSLLCRALLDGSYQPGDIRRVWIPKGGGKMRGLGIPNVVDRVVQESVRRVLEPLYEPFFHPSSHGFRPGRGCQTAITEAARYVEQGHSYVVDVDLEKFFDQVSHQRLMSRLAQRVEDKGLLVLIGKMLKAKVILPNGVKVATDEGVPQGGPLSPLLSNIVLDELDWELDQRGHKFVRYADDFNIYVKSERAGHRVMASVEKWIVKRLRLKVNSAKSAVARPDDRHFLGFRLVPRVGEPPLVLLSERSVKRLEERVRELTPRNAGRPMKSIIVSLNVYIRGWLAFFGRCTADRATVVRTLETADAHIRRRLRAIQLKQWKTKSTIAKRLIALGVKKRLTWRRIYEGRKSIWALSKTYPVQKGLGLAFFAEMGLKTLVGEFTEIKAQQIATRQLSLFSFF